MTPKKITFPSIFVALAVICFLATSFYNVSKSYAACASCLCTTCQPAITGVHETVRDHVTTRFEEHREWLSEPYFFEAQIINAMMLMAEQLSAIGMQQTQIIGSFFDAKHQLETQRLFQTLVARSHKDYHPSEGLCEIGTNMRSLVTSERQADLGKIAFANRTMQRQLLSEDVVSGEGERSDRLSRLDQFRSVYCNPTDNAGNLDLLCGGGGIPGQLNLDVDYTNTLENKLTLDINLIDPPEELTADQRNIFALNANIFGHESFKLIANRLLANANNQPQKLANFYYQQRAIAAKRSVAQNSFASLAAMRTSGDGQNAPFLRSVLQELGIELDVMDDYIGADPSYFAQMEVLTKKIYQNPKFYANLYDKPANIERKGAALQAIALMQDRDIYKSLLRGEAVLATLLETLISDEHDRISRDLTLNDQGERY